MRLLSGAFTLVLSAACMPQAGNSQAVEEKVLAPAPIQDKVVGEYVVTYVNGAPPVINIAGHEPTLTIGEERIHFRSQCIYADWTYRRAGEAITTRPYFVPGSGMCARGLAPGETAIQNALDAASTVRRIRGGLYLEGGGHRLQLRRVVRQASSASCAVDMAGEWRVAELDGQELNKPHAIALSADHEQIWWEPECALQYRDYTIHGSRFRAKPEDQSRREVCDIGLPEELPRVWSALDAADTIDRTGANGVRISGEGRSITLYSQ
jgi:hypothetical protein